MRILSVRGKFTYPAGIIILENIGKMNGQEKEESNILNTKDRVFFISDTLSCSNSHSSILPRFQTTTEPQTSRAGNHFTSEKIQTAPLGQGANEI